MKKYNFLIALLVGYVFALDINTATEEELAQINGVSKAKAGKIVKLREKLGGFKADTDITKAKIGIGKKTLENIKNDVKKSGKKKTKSSKKKSEKEHKEHKEKNIEKR